MRGNGIGMDRNSVDSRRDYLGLGLSIVFVLGLLILPGLVLAAYGVA